ncbi:MAG: uracil-xanthine permease [Lachnospiraceae bacterium]|nr:uracil-xanthine permease [Lachnospiraceae bacterium]
MAATQTGIYDARKQLGWPQAIILGIQHVFAMFGATVLVPLLTGLSVSVTLFCAGIATLWFHFITKGKVPVFLGSSFAFLGAFASIANGDPALLPYATGGILCAGLVYVVLAALIYALGAKRVMTLFPPVVTGPIIVLIGLILAPSALNNCLSGTLANPGQPRWIISVIAIAVIIICNIFGKGMIKILPILISIIVSYIVAFVAGWTKPLTFNGIIALPPFHMPKFEIGAIITCVVVALAAIIEHVGDVAAIGATCGKNFIKDPGLTRTLLGDGIGTSIAGALGGPANTTYSENTGVVALTGVYDPFVLRVAAVVAILLSIIPAVDGFINTIPDEVIGGISFVLYGMISAIGLRTLVEHKVDFANQRNVIIAAIILVSGLAFNSSPAQFRFGTVTLSFGGLACAAVLGIVLNAILPGKDYTFED